MARTVSGSVEGRSFERVKVAVGGRYMLEDRSEHKCDVVAMSTGDMVLKARHVGHPGEKVIAYLNHIGRVEGVVTQRTEDGFVITLVASERKRDKLASQLTWLANKEELGLPDGRRHERVVPRDPKNTMRLADGREYPCRVIDLSVSGAAVEISVKPGLGQQVALGTMSGKVVRHFDDGVAIEFNAIQPKEVLQS